MGLQGEDLDKKEEIKQQIVRKIDEMFSREVLGRGEVAV